MTVDLTVCPYLNEFQFQPVPQELIALIESIFIDDPHIELDVKALGHANRDLPQTVQAWLNKNIMQGSWHIQYFDRDQPIHKDPKTSTRLLYLLNPGGPKVLTGFYTEDKVLIKQTQLQPQRWYILKADQWHDVQDILPGRLRIMITARVFAYEASYKDLS